VRLSSGAPGAGLEHVPQKYERLRDITETSDISDVLKMDRLNLLNRSHVEPTSVAETEGRAASAKDLHFATDRARFPPHKGHLRLTYKTSKR